MREPAHGIRNRAFEALIRFSKARSRRNLRPWLVAALNEYRATEAGPVFNIGAGGEVQAWLDALGIETISVDIDRAREPDIVADIAAGIPVPDRSAAIVMCIEVLEHVLDARHAVAEILRVMKPGGVLIGSTPFLLGIHDAPHDFQRFTRFGLEELLGDFEVETLRARNGYFAALSVLISRRFVVGSESELRRARLLSPLLVSLSLIFDLLDHLLPSADATTGYFFVARKPAMEITTR